MGRGRCEKRGKQEVKIGNLGIGEGGGERRFNGVRRRVGHCDFGDD